MSHPVAGIEIFQNGKWQTAAEVTLYGEWQKTGYHAASGLSYNFDYALSHLHNDYQINQIGCRYPVNFDHYTQEGWPAFLLDLLPTGAARNLWLKRLSLKEEDESSWWRLLKEAAGNPPGNLRIAGAATVRPDSYKHPGFTRQEVIEKNCDFIEYAEQSGAFVAGASDVQGQAPKFLLVQDKKNRWHAEGSLLDSQVQSHWIVKFSRSAKKADKEVLANEAPYYETARAFGLRVGEPLSYQEDTLFIPRFDRLVIPQGIERYGMESLSSICGINEFGRRLSHNEACKWIGRFTISPRREILEYIKRDVLNTALRNTDNHGRNTALLKFPDGNIKLSPLFDFAPMFLDPEGIARSSRWDGAGEERTGMPDWGQVATDLETEIGIPNKELRHWLTKLAPCTEQLPETMKKSGVELSLIDKLVDRITTISTMLRDVQPHI